MSLGQVSRGNLRTLPLVLQLQQPAASLLRLLAQAGALSELPLPRLVLLPSASLCCGRLCCISRESNPGHIDGNDVFCH